MRETFDATKIHPAIHGKISSYQSDVIEEVKRLIAANDVVVVGMAQNPFPRRARRLLDQRKVPYKYLEIGSYMSLWRRRLALKMWTGWSTFPMIFVKGNLVGGFEDLERLVVSGEFDRLLARN